MEAIIRQSRLKKDLSNHVFAWFIDDKHNRRIFLDYIERVAEHYIADTATAAMAEKLRSFHANLNEIFYPSVKKGDVGSPFDLYKWISNMEENAVSALLCFFVDNLPAPVPVPTPETAAAVPPATDNTQAQMLQTLVSIDATLKQFAQKMGTVENYMASTQNICQFVVKCLLDNKKMNPISSCQPVAQPNSNQEETFASASASASSPTASTDTMNTNANGEITIKHALQNLRVFSMYNDDGTPFSCTPWTRAVQRQFDNLILIVSRITPDQITDFVGNVQKVALEEFAVELSVFAKKGVAMLLPPATAAAAQEEMERQMEVAMIREFLRIYDCSCREHGVDVGDLSEKMIESLGPIPFLAMTHEDLLKKVTAMVYEMERIDNGRYVTPFLRNVVEVWHQMQDILQTAAQEAAAGDKKEEVQPGTELVL